MAYNEFFDNSIIPQQAELNTIDIDLLLDGISGESLLSSGSISSQSKRLTMDMDGDTFAVNDGTIERIRLGRFDDGEYGLRIQDRDGNILFNITGTQNLIQSASRKMQLDMTNNQAKWFDDRNLRILIGDL